MPTTIEPPRKKSRGTLRAVLLLILVFFLGLAMGAGVVLLGFRQMARRAFTESPQANAPLDRFLARVENHFSHKLALTPEERSAIHEELVSTGRQFKDDRRTFLEAVRKLIDDTIERMCQRLPPEKAARLRVLARMRLAPWGIQPQEKPAGEKPTAEKPAG